MTPEILAALHARCFVVPAPWDAAAFAELLSAPGVVLLSDPDARGFLLARIVADEAEVLTLAVDPAHRRLGLGRVLMGRFDEAMQARGACTGFLEVAADNAAGRALYAACGWSEAGRRRAYYRTPGQSPVDALILCKPLAQD